MEDKQTRWMKVIQSLLDRAGHPKTPPAEAASARAKALHLAEKYSINLGAEVNPVPPSAVKPNAGNYTGQMIVEMGIRYAENCHCHLTNPLDPGGTYGAPLFGYTVQVGDVRMLAVLCPTHGLRPVPAPAVRPQLGAA